MKTTMKKSLILGAALAAFAAPAMAEDVIGINSAVKGQVTIQTGQAEARKAVVKDDVRLGDQVNSEKTSSLQVLLKDQTVFTVGPECELTIDKFVYDPSKTNNTLKANVSKGMFRFMSGNISKSGVDAVGIDTPVASLGVRGTIVEGLVGNDAIRLARSLGLIPPNQAVDPTGATLFVLRGPGPNRRGLNKKGEITVTSAGGSETLTKSGQAVFVADALSPPTKPIVLPAAAFELFNDRLRTEPTAGPDFRPFDVDVFVTPPSRRDDDDLPVQDLFDPANELDWPEEDIFNSPCGSNICDLFPTP